MGDGYWKIRPRTYWQLWNIDAKRSDSREKVRMWRVLVAVVFATFKFNNKVTFTTHLHRISVNWIHLHDFSFRLVLVCVLSFSVHANFVIVYLFKHTLALFARSMASHGTVWYGVACTVYIDMYIYYFLRCQMPFRHTHYLVKFSEIISQSADREKFVRSFVQL